MQARRSTRQGQCECQRGGRKGLTEIAAIECMLCFRAESTEARSPSSRFLLHLGVVWVDTTRPWPSCKGVRNEDLSRSIFIVVLLDGPLLCYEAIDETLSPSGEQDRDTIGGEMDDQAYECAEREKSVGFHTGGSGICLTL